MHKSTVINLLLLLLTVYYSFLAQIFRPTFKSKWRNVKAKFFSESVNMLSLLKICTPMHLKDPKWIKKSKAMKRKMEIGQTFTIQSIEICLIEVWWCTSNGHTEYGELKEDEIKR